MPGATVRYRRDRWPDAFEVEGHGFFGELQNTDGIGGPAAILGPASLSRLLAVVRKAYAYNKVWGYEEEYGPTIYISNVEPENFDNKHSPLGPLSIEWRDGRYRAVLEMELSNTDVGDMWNDQRQLSEHFRKEIDPWLQRHGCRYVMVEYGEGSGFAGIDWVIRIVFDPPRGVTVAQLLEISAGLRSVLDLIDQGGLTFDLFRS
jgi:hypothetical protein